MAITLENIWINQSIDPQNFRYTELRLDWSNARHHAVRIQPPFGVTQVTKALRSAAALISGDPNLITPLQKNQKQTKGGDHDKTRSHRKR